MEKENVGVAYGYCVYKISNQTAGIFPGKPLEHITLLRVAMLVDFSMHFINKHRPRCCREKELLSCYV